MFLTKMILRRLLGGIILLLVVSSLTFVLVSLIPGDAAASILGPTASPAQLEALRTQLGLDKPVWQQYLTWLGGALHGDLGTSIIAPQSVTATLNGAVLVTVPLAIIAVFVSMLIGTSLGVLAAFRGGLLSRIIDVFTLAGLAIPSFWFAIVLANFFGVQLGWLPPVGYVPFAQSPVDWARSLILPVVAMAIQGIAAAAKQSRDSFEEVFRIDFIDALKVEGLSPRRLFFGHTLRNAAIPVLAVTGAQMIGTLGGVVIIETIFALPGLGMAAVTATIQHDLPVVVGAAMYFCLMVIIVNLGLDIAYGALNPKARVKS